jgi:hypothetical protein
MEWFIPGNVPSSKNGRRWTGKYFIASKSVMNYRKNTKKYYTEFADDFKSKLSECELPVHIEFKFVRSTKHKFDYINPAQTVQDDMVKHGWIEDDNAEYLIPVFAKYSYDKSNPGVYIRLLCKKKKLNP